MQLTSSRVFESSKLDSLPVVAIDEGRILGRVRDLIFDPSSHVLLGVIVSRNGGDPDAFLDMDHIRQLGPFALTIFRSDDLQPLDSSPRAFEVAESGIRVRGAPVMTEIGEPIGRLDKIWLDSSGRIQKYRASNGGLGFGHRREITPDDVIVIGTDVVIVASAAVDARPPGDPAHRPASQADEST